MEGLQNRIDSFSKTKRVKNPAKPSSTVTVKWPHSPSFIANPNTLAEAGFYYNPSAEDPDNVTCFMCEKQLSDWEADDDPFDIHYDKCSQQCSWAFIRCGLRRDMDRNERFIFQDKTRLPTSKAMEKARLDTFSAGNGWIHDKVRNHGASSKRLAKAGFVLMSNYSGDDLASCIYCNISLSGWDKNDDPMQEHRKRKGKTCPFFASDTSEHPSSDSSQTRKPPSKASMPKPPSRTASKSKQHQDMVMPTKLFDGDPDGDNSDSAESSTSGVPVKTPARKARALSGSTRKPSAKTPRARSTSRSLKNVAEETPEEDEDDEQEAPATLKKKITRARSKSTIKSVASEVDEGEVKPAVAPPTTVKRTKTATRAKSVARNKASEADEDPEDSIPIGATTAKKKKAAARSQSKTVTKSEQSDFDDEPDVEDTTRRLTRSKGKGKAPTPSETDEGENEEPAPRKSSRTKSKTTAPSASKKSAALKSKIKPKVPQPEPEERETDDEEVQLPEISKARKVTKKPPSTANSKTKARTKEIRGERISEDEFGPIIEQPPFAPAAVAKAKPPPSTAKNQTLVGAASIGKGMPPSRNKPAPSPAEPPLQTDDDDELGGYLLPPSSPPHQMPVAEVDQDVEMTPLVIPKRTTAAPKASTKQSKRPSQAGKPSSVKVRASIAKVQPKLQMKVVDVETSDEDEEVVVVEEQETVEELRVDLQSKTKPKGKSNKGEKSRLLGSSVFGIEEKGALREMQGNSSSSSIPLQTIPPTPSQSRDGEIAQEKPGEPEQVEDGYIDTGDVSMQETDIAETQLFENDSRMEDIAALVETPRTPLRIGSNLPAHPGFGVTDQAYSKVSQNDNPNIESSKADDEEGKGKETQPAPFLPPLSKMPFMPLPELTEAELDMTVEEWIRYQMEVEFDKFKRDGERELQRFRKSGEEVRKVIEGL